MAENSKMYHRRSGRYRGYDYSQAGFYFITLCTYNKWPLFGDIIDGCMVLNDAGHVVRTVWGEIPDHFKHANLHEFVIMPDHVHGIIEIVESPWVHNVGANNYSPLHYVPLHPHERPSGTTKTIGSMVRGFKIGVTKWFRKNTCIYTVWQRNYYDHIIRDEYELTRIRQYIVDNPRKSML